MLNEILTQHRMIFSSNASEYDARTRGAYRRYLGAFARAFTDRVGSGRVLDLGCAAGRDLQYFGSRGLSAKGIDLSPEMVALCCSRGLEAECADFLAGTWVGAKWDGIWAYTSLTLVPKAAMRAVLEGARAALVPGNGVLALGLIEGEGEGWKRDGKYGGERRYVARYSSIELREVLSRHFGRVSLERVKDPESEGRVYLHALCQNVPPVSAEAAGRMASELFGAHGADYERRTASGTLAIEPELAMMARTLGRGAKVLDLGSGPGRDATALREAGVAPTCLDIAPWNVARCRARGLDATIGRIEDADTLFPAGSFDGAWSNCALTNWLPLDALISGLAAVTKVVRPGGLIFIGSVLGGFSGEERDEKYGGLPRHNQHWDEAELRQLLSGQGEILSWRIEDATHLGKKRYAYTVIRTPNEGA